VARISVDVPDRNVSTAAAASGRHLDDVTNAAMSEEDRTDADDGQM